MGGPKETKPKLDEFASTFDKPPQPSKQQKFDEKYDLCDKIQLADGRPAYILWRFARSSYFFMSEPHDFKCFIGDKAEIVDNHIEHG